MGRKALVGKDKEKGWSMRDMHDRYGYAGRMLLAGMLLSLTLAAGCKKEQQKAAGGAAPGGMTPEVSVFTVTTSPITLNTELPGRTSAYRIAEIRPQVSGIIQKRLFREGSDVKTGAVLYQIDPDSFQAAYDNAVAALGQAEANLPAARLRATRYRKLLQQKAVSQQELDDAEAEQRRLEALVRHGQAAVKSARINLNYTRITAPISGRIGRSSVTDGALVSAYQAQALTSIQQLDPIYVDVTQSTADLLRLKRKLESGNLHSSGERKVRILLEDGSVYRHPGILQFKDVTVDSTTGAVALRVVVPNPEGDLLPGMFVRAQVYEGDNAAAILVPQQAVTRDPKGNPEALIVLPDNRLERRSLVLERTVDDKWLVSKGLQAGEVMVIEGFQRVRAGMTVKPVPYAGPAAPKTPAGGGA